MVSTANAVEYDFQPGAQSFTLSGPDATKGGAHPDVNVTFGLLPDPTVGIAPGRPAQGTKTSIVALPPGLVGNPQTLDTCSIDDVLANETPATAGKCPRGSAVGWATFDNVFPNGLSLNKQRRRIWRVPAAPSEAAAFATSIISNPVRLVASVTPSGGYRITMTGDNLPQTTFVRNFEATFWGVPADHQGLGLDCDGAFNTSSGVYACADGTAPGSPGANTGVRFGAPLAGAKRTAFLSNPSQCTGSPLQVDLFLRPWGVRSPISTVLDGPTLTDCASQPFDPSISIKPTSRVADAPTGLNVELKVPQNDAPAGRASGHVKDVTVALPAGISISPSSANGLRACTDAQIGLREDGPAQCPDASKLGTVEVVTPLLEEPLTGHVLLGTQESDDPMSGRMFRVFIVASGSGVVIKLEGGVTADPSTGQLTASFKNNPQMPFDALRVKFFSGPGAPLATPTACGAYTARAAVSSWTGKAIDVLSTSTVDCRPGLGGFTPSFSAGTINPAAGASSPLSLRVTKPDAHSDLNRITMTLPEGLLANLKGNIGQRVGTARVAAGSGSTPFWLSGPVVLEGAYGDAPFSLRVTVPAIAGPFNLGNVVVRQKIYVDPNDAHVTVVSDPLPTIVKGVPVRLQHLAVDIDKAGFMQNPTSCDVKSISGTLGAATGQTAAVGSRFQVGDCASLAYKPQLGLSLGGPSKELGNGGHPQLDATLTTGKGEANQRKAQVTLPLNLALDPDNAKALCEPAAVPTNSCPADSIVGKATAVSILDVPLEGPVYFVRGERTSKTGRVIKTLPKLFIPLSGQGVRVNLHASSSVVDRKLQTTFDNLPDAPIERFVLQINGGGNGILKVTNGDICKSTSTPRVRSVLSGQNGKRYRQSSTLGSGCRFGVVKTRRNGNRVTLTVGGLGHGGKLKLSGGGAESSSRSVGKSSTVASLGVSLDRSTQRAVKQGRTVRLRLKASFKPKGKKTVSTTKTVTIKPAKK